MQRHWIFSNHKRFHSIGLITLIISSLLLTSLTTMASGSENIIYSNPNGLSINFTISKSIIFNGTARLGVTTSFPIQFTVIWEMWLFLGEKIYNYQTGRHDGLIFTPGEGQFDWSFGVPFDAFPGEYDFTIFIYWLDTTTLSFALLTICSDVVAVMLGPLYSVIFMIGLVIGLIYLLLSKERLYKLPIIPPGIGARMVHFFWSQRSEQPAFGQPQTGGMMIELPQAKIRCPDCLKKIWEGSAFCSHCGYHLRVFERYLR